MRGTWIERSNVELQCRGVINSLKSIGDRFENDRIMGFGPPTSGTQSLRPLDKGPTGAPGDLAGGTKGPGDRQHLADDLCDGQPSDHFPIVQGPSKIRNVPSFVQGNLKRLKVGQDQKAAMPEGSLGK